MPGVVRPARLVPLFVVVLLANVLSVAAAGPAVAQTQSRTFTAVQCTAVVNGSTISQSQDVSVSITAPDSVAPNSSFTVTFPGGTAMLPTESNGLTITSYSNIFLTYQIHNTTFTSNTIVNPGTATLIPAGSTTPKTIVQQASLPAGDQIKSGEPGPFSPGTAGPNNEATLITPDISVNATAPASGSVTLNALSLTTNVVLNGSIKANVTCNVPQDTIITIPVGGTANNTPPTVNAGPDASGNVSAPIALSGSVTDPDSTPTDTWTINDPACTFANAAAPSTTVMCTKPGTFTATLTGDDHVNPPVSDTAQVFVTQSSSLVVSAGGPVSGAVSHQIALHGSVSDPGHTPAVSWTANSPACAFANTTAASTTISCTATGTFVATLTANDGGTPVSDTATVAVNPDIPPTVDAGPDASGNTATAIALHGTVTDPDDTPSVHWTAGDPRCSFADATKPATTITCSVQGNYTATLTANDGFNPAVSDTVSVAVTDILFPFNWDVDATTHLKTLNQDVTVPTGNFTGVVDLTTGQLGGDITLPPAAFTFSLAGVGLVTADMQIAETQSITGSLDVSTFAVSATAVFDIKITSLHPTATPTVNLVGNSCKTSTPVSVTMQGTADLSGSSTFSGTYTIPPLQNCGVLTTALNLVIPGPGNTFSATVYPPPVPPSVTAQPTDETVAPGQTYSFTAEGAGTPDPTVQWQVSTNGGSTFSDISGATDGTYSAAAALADSGKKFRAVFTNSSGTADSDAATLTVAVAPQITTQPADQSVTAGSAYTFQAAASGTPAPTAQWQVSTDGGSTFQDIAGATNDSITGTAAMSDSGKQFRAVYTNAGGTATTNSAVLTVGFAKTISIGAASVVEGDTGGNRTVNLAVTLAQVATQNVTVHYASTDVTAVAPTDYTARTGNLIFKPGVTTLYVGFTVKPNTVVEQDKMFQVVLSNPGGGFSLSANHAVAPVTILDDDASSALRVSVGDDTVCRGGNGKAELASVWVSLSSPATSTVTVKLTLSAGTATSGTDFTQWKPKTITFNAGQFQKVVTVSVPPGWSQPASVTALLTLSNPSAGLSIARAQGTVTIANHD